MEPCECAMTVHHGRYSTLSEAYGAAVNWIMENGYEIAGTPFDLYIKTQFDSLSPEDWETEVYFPIKKTMKWIEMSLSQDCHSYGDSPVTAPE